MDQCIGQCSLCGGDVMGHVGPYHSVIPPPPPTCNSCGAVTADSRRVIPMVPRLRPSRSIHDHASTQTWPDLLPWALTSNEMKP